MMRSVAIIFLYMLGLSILYAQSAVPPLTVLTKINSTTVKNQGNTGTCWSFSTTSLIESQTLKANAHEIDLSEMFTVRNIYADKARNYILRQGAAQFGSGGLGHDVINSMAHYGAVPESVYSGLLLGKKYHNHDVLDGKLKSYLDSLLKLRPLPGNWMEGFQSILDENLGKVPESFLYNEIYYTPKTFATEVLHFKANDYIAITSFTHHPFYEPFVLEVPDNFANGMYYNVPLDEMIRLVKESIRKGYSVMWDADVSNSNFRQQDGFAMEFPKGGGPSANVFEPDAKEVVVNQALRQVLYENLTTQDDHLMHLTGLERSNQGKEFFVIKNSWGEVGPFKGYIHVSEAYFALNTISLVLPRAALSDALKTTLHLK